MASYERVMLKVSGEQLGSPEYNFDMRSAARICSVIEALVQEGRQVACVVGGGNVIRGAKLEKNGFKNRVIADQMGMLATIQNGLFLAEALEDRDEVRPVVMSKVGVDSLVEGYSVKRGEATLRKVGSIVIVTGGTGNAGFTTDTGTVTVAFELACDAVVKTTNVDGVYTDDPNTNPNATRIPSMTLEEALVNPNINVMDNAALAMARDHGMTIAITRPTPKHVSGVLDGDTSLGTLVTP